MDSSIKDEHDFTQKPVRGSCIYALAAKGYTDDACWLVVRDDLTEGISAMLVACFGKYGFVGPVHQNFDSRKAFIVELAENCFPSFAIQRVAELVLDHSRYTSTHKLMNAAEKLLSISAAGVGSTSLCTRNLCVHSNRQSIKVPSCVLGDPSPPPVDVSMSCSTSTQDHTSVSGRGLESDAQADSKGDPSLSESTFRAKKAKLVDDDDEINF